MVTVLNRFFIQVDSADRKTLLGETVHEPARSASRLKRAANLAIHEFLEASLEKSKFSRCIATEHKVVICGEVINAGFDFFHGQMVVPSLGIVNQRNEISGNPTSWKISRHFLPVRFRTKQLTQSRDQVLAQMRWARQYSLQLIESFPEELWYSMPQGIRTHLAWQVGHLAVSQYGLMLFRQRGRLPGDLDLMPGWLRKQFGRGSQPANLEAGKAPPPSELLGHLRSIHEQALAEVAEESAEQLREPTEMPFTAYPIKLGALLFCPIHESIHAGQIGVLRRAHGLDPLR